MQKCDLASTEAEDVPVLTKTEKCSYFSDSFRTHWNTGKKNDVLFICSLIKSMYTYKEIISTDFILESVLVEKEIILLVKSIAYLNLFYLLPFPDVWLQRIYVWSFTNGSLPILNSSIKYFLFAVNNLMTDWCL